MPVVQSATPLSAVSLPMASASGATNPSTSYATLNAVNTNVNNVAANSAASVVQTVQGGNMATTKYIQLQSPRPTPSVTNHQGVESVSSSSQNTITAAVRPATTIPPGMVFTRTSSGQLVLVNNNGNQYSNQQQSQSSTVPTAATKVLTTVSMQSAAGNVTTIGKPVQLTTHTTNHISTDVKPVVVKTESSPTTTANITLSEEDISNVTKCRNFLTTLIKLASTGGQLQETVRNVKVLVQNLIDDKVSPEEFTRRLQVELNSSPQPYLIPFLRKSLPLLRLTMMQQNQSGQVPTTIAQAAIRVSSLSHDKNNTVNKKTPNKITRPTPVKSTYKVNNVPDIRLPRVQVSTTAPLKHPSLQPPQTYPFQQPPHPSSVTGARSTVLTAIRPSMMAGRSGQRYTGSTPSSSTYRDDDDINDVASMAGVNLSEENARILATNSELVGTQTRSCKDDVVANVAVLQRRMTEIASKNPDIQHIHADAVKFLSFAVESKVKELLEKLSAAVSHRLINFKDDEHYKACSDVKGQLKFLQELDQIEKKKHDEAERDILMRAMKSRSKNDNPEQLRLKERAREMQQQELEKLQIRNADETARNAIGPRKKKPRLEPQMAGVQNESLTGGPSSSKSMVRSKVKRVNLRDLMFVMENEKTTCKSKLLFRSYLK